MGGAQKSRQTLCGLAEIRPVFVYRVRRLRQAAHPLATGEWDMGKSLLQSREIRLRGLNFQPTQVGLV